MAEKDDAVQQDQDDGQEPESLTLDDLFTEKGETQKAEPPTEETEAEPEKAAAEGEAEGDEAEGETDDAGPPPEGQDTIDGLKAGIAAERKKRQALEQQRAELEKRLAELDKREAPDPVDDPEGFEAHQKQIVYEARANASREFAKDAYSDYEEKEAEFMGMVTDEQGNITNPALVAQMRDHPNPAKFVYDYIREQEQIAQFRDPEKRAAYEAKIREEQAAKLREELIPEITKQVRESLIKSGRISAADLPDFTTATAQGSNATPRAKGVENVDDLWN